MGEVRRTLEKLNGPYQHKYLTEVIEELFPDPDALYTKTVSLPDGRQFVEIWDSGWPGGLLRMGGLTSALASYALTRIREQRSCDQEKIQGRDKSLERDFRDRLDIAYENTPAVRGEGHTTSQLVRYVAPPLEDREPLNPHLAAQYTKRGRPRGSPGALRGERHARDQEREEPKRPRGRPRTRPLPDPDTLLQPKRPRGRPRTRPLPDPDRDEPKRPRGRPRKTIDQIPWYSELVGDSE